MGFPRSRRTEPSPTAPTKRTARLFAYQPLWPFTSTADAAAVLHLVKIGQGLDAPWEVVGSIDTTFSLLQPRYGASVDSPLTVGGRITDVDESIRIDIRQPPADRHVGRRWLLPPCRRPE